ncbi:DNA-directed RNA polymerase I subunit 2, partial [Cucurbita argyrosperma subsp. sororia]
MVVKFSENQDYEALRELFRHHIESFDHLVDAGLETLMNSIKPVEIYDSFTNRKLRIWLGKPELYPPQKERNLRTMREALLPSECRQAKISYTGNNAEVKALSLERS